MNSSPEKPAKRAPRPGGIREMWLVAGPLIIGSASFTIMQFCDRLFLARHSQIAIRAALPAGVISFTLCCFFQALVSYSGVFVARYHGMGDSRNALKSAVQGLWIALFAFPLTVMLWPLGAFAMKTWQPPDILAAEMIYYNIFMAGVAVFYPMNAIFCYFTGVSRTRIVGMANVLSCGLNVFLDYVMIFGKFGFPEMGITGAAIASVFSAFVGMMILVPPFLRAVRREKRNALEPGQGASIAPASLWKLEPELCKRIVHFGIPSGIQMVIDLSAFSIQILVLGKYGAAAQAASNTALSINNLAFSPLMGFGNAAATLVSQHLGEGRPDVANKSGYSALILGAIYMTLIGLTFVLFPRFYFTLFQSQDAIGSFEEVLRLGRIMLIIATAWGFVDMMGIIFSSGLRGAGDTHYVMKVCVISSFAMVMPGTIIIANVASSVLWIWAFMAITIMIIGLCYAYRYRSGKWKEVSLLAQEEQP